MSKTLVPKSMLARLRLPALAAALAVAASASHAGAVVNITSFMITTDGSPFVAPKFAAASGQTSELEMHATNGGGSATNSAFYSANNWNDSPTNTTAQTSAAVATGNIISFTDALTQLQTGGFNLSAMAMPSGIGTLALPTSATAIGGQAGAFTLIDENGDPIAGTLTFDVFYDLTVSPAIGGSQYNFSNEALVIFSAADDDGGDSVSDMLSGFGPAMTSGQFTMSFELAAGELVLYSLAGSAAATAIPEPGSMALAMLGLFAAGASCRRPRRQA
jgi:hypothetical protein